MMDFSKMTGEELCDWLQSHGVVFDEDCGMDEVDDWNLPACAFAARDYMIAQITHDSWCDVIQDAVGDASIASPLDWLRAAARVMKENGQ